MSCIAVWGTQPSETRLPYELEVHFNLWKVKKRWRCFKETFLDIGIMVVGNVDLETVNIFFPVKFDKSHIHDLGALFRDNIELTAAVFNEDWRAVPVGEKTLEVQGSNFSIYELDVNEKDVIIENAYGGSIVSICIPKQLRSRKHCEFR